METVDQRSEYAQSSSRISMGRCSGEELPSPKSLRSKDSGALGDR